MDPGDEDVPHPRATTPIGRLLEWERESMGSIAATDRTVAFARRHMPNRSVLAGRYVASICLTCGGWIMVHAEPTSSNGETWARRERNQSNTVVVFWRSTDSLGPACPVEGCEGQSSRQGL